MITKRIWGFNMIKRISMLIKERKEYLIIALITLFSVIFVASTFFATQFVDNRINYLKKENTSTQKSIEKLLIQQEEKNNLEQQLDDIKSKNDDMENNLNKFRASADMTNEEIKAVCTPILEQLYKEKEEYVELLSSELINVQQMVDLCILDGTDSISYVNDTDYLADAVSEITGLDSAGTAVSSIVESIQNGESIGDAVKNAISDSSQDTINDITLGILNKVFPVDEITTVMDFANFFSERSEAKISMLEEINKNNHYYSYSFGMMAEREEIDVRDFAFIKNDLTSLDSIMQANCELTGKDFGYSGFKENRENIVQYYNKQLEIEKKIAFYESLIGTEG